MAYITIGNMHADWDENEPLFFNMSEAVGSKDDLRVDTYHFDLSSLRDIFEDVFLIHLKEHLINRRYQIALVTIWTEYRNLVSLFKKVIAKELFVTKQSIISESFLLAMSTIKEDLQSLHLEYLRRAFNSNPHSPMFDRGLREDDFPVMPDKKSAFGKLIDNIIAKALSRSACVEILCRCEEAYEDGEIDIGLFSFINLAFAVYVRPDSYRRIRLNDLVRDTAEKAFFLYIPPAKSGVHNPQKICNRITEHVGVLLLKQRQHVIEMFGNLVSKDNIGKLALFPSTGLNGDKTRWTSEHANKFFGEFKSGDKFSNRYFIPIHKLLQNCKYKISASALRHTIGTQLAVAGCSSKTIQAVLKHADDRTCMAYVDIIFQGLINELSDTMQPAFEAHMPVFERFRSKDNLITANKAVYSENLETGRNELIGECGKQIRCQAAPFTCYGCNKFIPCFDADHSLNLDIIQSEIDLFKHAGTPFKYLVEKAKTIKYQILLVMTACDRYQQIIAEQKG